MPQPYTKVESMGAKTIPGVSVGYHIHPGAMWSGDYLVADLAPLRKNFDVTREEIKIHRIREVVTNHTGKFSYPVAEWRMKNLLKGEDSDALTDPDMPDFGRGQRRRIG